MLLVGVGGQGTILASKILTEGLLKAGYDVKCRRSTACRRGGNVSTQIRFGDKVYSPIMGKGEADVIVAFEKMEALRWIEYLKQGGEIVVNDFEMPTIPIQIGAEQYPQGVLEILQEAADTVVIKAGDIARDLGNSKTMNVVLLGALVKAMRLDEIDWEALIRKNVKRGFEEINWNAFKEGYQI
ncbi:indolepyruvate oxidoreductase subunit beta [Anoxybacterium hadale]|uniref:Indolepyruvate oxidoreductase subunit beta n=1 Tax=Anoxybacterium hadale TaxID=3408580 RepID=A0ACD1ABU5_9FIRM|nr:indolepyruvate oxidoreductase subunit beta [Clostridiales bacterium]